MTTPEYTAALRRIEKMLAIANDARANPNEAAAAAHQAEKLMRKFQVDHEDVIRANLKKGDSFVTQYVQAKMKQGKETSLTPKRQPTWAQWLAVEIAKLNDCLARCERLPGEGVGAGMAIAFQGYDADVQVCCWTFHYLVHAVVANIRGFQKEAVRSKADSESYRRGFVTNLLGQLSAARKAKQTEEMSSGRDLVVVKMQAVASHFGEAKYKETRAAGPKNVDAYVRGRADGAKVDAHRKAVGTTKNDTKLIA